MKSSIGLLQPLYMGSAIALIGATLTLTMAPGQALTLVTERANLGSNDQLDWASLGSATPFKVLPYSFAATSEQGLGIHVNIPFLPPNTGITPPLVFQTAPPPRGIPTNFAAGDSILFTGLDPTKFPAPGNPGPLSILFDHPVQAAGTQIAVDDTLSFQATIAAFDSQDTLLGTFTINATSSLALDNSAAFLGVQSDQPNIAKLVYRSSESNRAIGINQLSLHKVPEPTPGWACLLVGLGSLGYRLQRSRR